MRRMAEAYLAAPAITAELGGIRLAPHQVDAASRLLALSGEWGGAVLADATGLGKTFVAIAVARVVAPALVVAPASLRGMWREALGRTGVDARVESYEGLSRGGTCVAERPALLVLDEAHHARNPRSKRYAVLADLAWGARVLLLTATPIHNRIRDLRALVALFMGSRADTIGEDELRSVIVRRTSGSWGGIDSPDRGAALPSLGKPRWLAVPGDHETLRAITALPAAVATAGGATAHALLLLGLIRAWSSSEAALRAMLRRRLRRAASFDAALESGRVPDRRELASWLVVDDAIQLGFAELLTSGRAVVDVMRIRAALERHVDGVRAIMRSLDRDGGAADEARRHALASIRERHPSIPVVAFTQFANTANAAFRGCASGGGVALVTGHGARIASGRVTVEEIVRGFDIADHGRSAAAAMPLELLFATDVLSEGLSLRRAGVIVHLDLPWTVARLEQRVGRLRRIGSEHRCIHVYAIGPPIEARELLPVIRSLQRKARLASNIAGHEESASSLPLLGERLTRATVAIARRGDSHMIEELRQALSLWLDGALQPRSPGARPDPRFLAVALLGRGASHRLLAIQDDAVSDRLADVLRTVRVLSSRFEPEVHEPHDVPLTDAVFTAANAVERWLNEERGREIARPATDSPSTAHTGILRALQEMLLGATRSDRIALAKRIERCRQRVTSARGIGAELALARVLSAGTPLDLDALERIFESHLLEPNASPQPTRLEAMLCLHPDAGEVIALSSYSSIKAA